VSPRVGDTLCRELSGVLQLLVVSFAQHRLRTTWSNGNDLLCKVSCHPNVTTHILEMTEVNFEQSTIISHADVLNHTDKVWKVHDLNGVITDVDRSCSILEFW